MLNLTNAGAMNAPIYRLNLLEDGSLVLKLNGAETKFEGAIEALDYFFSLPGSKGGQIVLLDRHGRETVRVPIV